MCDRFFKMHPFFFFFFLFFFEVGGGGEGVFRIEYCDEMEQGKTVEVLSCGTVFHQSHFYARWDYVIK